MGTALPPGQRALEGAPPRFGLDAYMRRRVVTPAGFKLRIGGELEAPLELSLDEVFPERTEQVSDLHCVTTWSAVGLRWSGRPFRSFWEEVVVPRARPRAGVAWLRVRALDGYAMNIPLEEALRDETFLADGLGGAPLGEHGEPLRFVVPHLYGYKNVKHVASLELLREAGATSAGRMISHPRGRVDLEERSGVGGQRFWRVLYRLLLPLFFWRARSLASRG